MEVLVCLEIICLETLWVILFSINSNSAGIYLLKVNNRNTRIRCEICSKLTIKIPERRQWDRSGIFIVHFEHISHLVSTVSIVNFEHLIAGWGKDWELEAKTNLKWYHALKIKAWEFLCYIHSSLTSFSVLLTFKSLSSDNLSLDLHEAAIFWVKSDTSGITSLYFAQIVKTWVTSLRDGHALV